jgi:adenylate cyclase
MALSHVISPNPSGKDFRASGVSFAANDCACVLNRHFGLQAMAVQEHHGIVDKFVGDSIMAFWGPPFVKAEEHAVLACRAALIKLVALDTLRRELPEITGLRRDVPTLELGIGICTGEVVVGNIGLENTRSYCDW